MEESNIVWFTGSLTKAVEQVKNTNCLLIVFIQGGDEVSNRYNTFFNKGIPLESVRYIAVKIVQDSLAFEQFRKIYVTVPIPSVFIIGSDGKPLSIVCSNTPDKILDALKEGAEKQKKAGDQAEAEAKAVGKAEANAEAEAETEAKAKQSPLVDFERSKFLMEDKKMEFEKARKFSTLSLYETLCSCDKHCRSQKIQSARIQFRLPSNEVRSWDFPNLSTLHDVKLYLMETVRLRSGFKLQRVYPRTAFTPEDDDKTLEDLSLTPSSTLIVVPVQGGFQANLKNIIAKNSLILTFFAALFKPVYSFISYFRRLLSSPEHGKFETRKKRRNGPAPKRFCKKSATDNVHRFAFDDSDSDSDMNTDNGNSTQQM